MPAKTEKQKKFFGAVMGAKKGQSKVSGEAKKVAKELPKKEIKKFLKTENEEDEQSVSKSMKKGNGKATFKGPEVKERKKFAPATKVEPSGKNYKRKNKGFDEDEELGEVPLKRDQTRHEKIGSEMKKKGQGKPKIDYSKLGEVPLKRDAPPKNKLQQMDDEMRKRKSVKENTNIARFIDSILTKNYAAADKYIKQAVECKLQDKIEQELSTPLF